MTRKHSPVFSLSWLYYAPPALHVIGQVYLGFLYPGVITLIAVYWTELTRAIWSGLARLIALDLTGYERLLDALTMSVLLLTAALGAHIRRDHVTEADPVKTRFRTRVWPGWWAILRVAFFLAILIGVFSYRAEMNHRALAAGAAVVFLVSCIVLALYFSYQHAAPEAGAVMWVIGGLQRGAVFLLGLVARGLLYWGALFIAGLTYLSVSGATIAQGLFMTLFYSSMAICAAAGPLAYVVFGYPKPQVLRADGEKIAALVLMAAMFMGMLFPFIPAAQAAPGETDPLYTALILILFTLFPAAVIVCIRTNWNIIPHILMLAAILILVDQTLGAASSFIERWLSVEAEASQPNPATRAKM